MISDPVVNVLVSPARYTRIDCNSSGFPRRPIGAIAFHCPISGFRSSLDMIRSVQCTPAYAVDSDTFLCHSTASDFVRRLTPAFDALYPHCGCGTFTICPDIEAVLMMNHNPVLTLLFLLLLHKGKRLSD